MSDELRTKIAQVVDPTVFELTEALRNANGYSPQLQADATAVRDQRLVLAMSKADAILALVSPPPVEGNGLSVDESGVRPSARTEDQHYAGWRLVPDEPSERMIEAGYDATRLAGGTPQFAGAGFCLGHAREIYRAMILSSGEPPIGSSERQRAEGNATPDTQNPSPPSPVEGETLWADAEKCAADQGGEQDA